MGASSNHTPTALKRWSCQDRPMPAVDAVTEIHVYDFDNTLFASPLPNKQLWNMSTFGLLQSADAMTVGGWWHNPGILAAVGEGRETEEPRAWEGCWNENIVELVRLSMRDPAAVTVLLTGRAENGFAELLSSMIKSKGLEFDMMCLKPAAGPTGETYANTMDYKQALLRDLVHTYARASELRIYEDRIKHVKAFEEFFADLNDSLSHSSGTPSRQPFKADVVYVTEKECTMNPDNEVAEVQKMINANNRAVRDGSAPQGTLPYKIKRSVLYTGYLLQPADSERLRALVPVPKPSAENDDASSSDIRFLANNILIAPRPAPAHLVQRLGGIGASLRWRVTGLGSWEDRIWAARVAPVDPNAVFHCENEIPSIVLAARRQTKPVEANRIRVWDDPGEEMRQWILETKIGEKVLLRVEAEERDEGNTDNSHGRHETSYGNGNGNGNYGKFAQQNNNSRKHAREEDFPPLGSERNGGRPSGPKGQQQQSQQQSRSQQQGGGGGRAWGGRSGGGRGGGGHNPRNRRNGGGDHSNGGGRSGGGGGRSGGGRGAYRSLDENAGSGYSGGGMQY